LCSPSLPARAMLEPLGPSSPTGAAPAARGYTAAAEVDTEYEDEGEAEQAEHAAMDERKLREPDDQTYEVEEELESTALAPEDGHDMDQESFGEAASSGVGHDDGTYAVPKANQEVWKQFGCNTEAGRALRRLYSNGSHKDAASRVSYPRLQSPSQRWEPKAGPRKTCPQRAPVRVPRAGGPKYDPDDPKNWRVPLPSRKPASQIMAEMEAERPQVPNLAPGRDQAVEKQQLQARFQFCGGRAMPKGAMGHVEATADLPQVLESMRGRMEDRRRKDENGMDAEQREIFEELMLAIKRKQERLREIDAEDAADPKPSKAKTMRNKEALELRNDIDRNVADIDKLLELTEEQ